jgi:RNA polymerase sigma-70 factor (ECF subfamily)
MMKDVPRERVRRSAFLNTRGEMTAVPADVGAATADRIVLEAIIREHQGAVYGYLRSRLTQPADAEDLTQEVFLRWYLNRLRFDASQKVRPWLIGIARNVLLEYLKRLQHRKEVAWTELCLQLEQLIEFKDDDDGYVEVLPHLPGCLEDLGTSARQALTLRYQSNLSLAQIAEQLRRSEGAVKLLMFRARQALKQCLGGKVNSHQL